MVENQSKQLWHALEKGQVKVKDSKHQAKWAKTYFNWNILIQLGCTTIGCGSVVQAWPELSLSTAVTQRPGNRATTATIEESGKKKDVQKTSLFLHTCRGFADAI